MNPAEIPAVPDLSDTALIAPAAPRSLRILVVDDDPGVRMFISAGLSCDGHDVETAPDGHAALKLHAARPFQVVVADLFMPGMSGLELASAIRELSAMPPLICMTGAAEEMKNTPFDLIIRKPFAHAVLRAAIERFCGDTASSEGIPASKLPALPIAEDVRSSPEPAPKRAPVDKVAAVVHALCYCGTGLPFKACCGNENAY